MLTCYDYSTAKIVEESPVDALLVGDSLAMTIYGAPTTLEASLEQMAGHTRAVARGSKKFLVSDLPFLSYRKGLKAGVEAVEVLMKSGASAVKLEGVRGNEVLVRHLTESGVPVMGHVGLTPQFVNSFGGYKVQGKTKARTEKIIEEAKTLEDCGCFAVVVECVPRSLGALMAEVLTIPVIGIGAGPETDGQILVLQDCLGMNTDFKPRFSRAFLEGSALIREALKQYHEAITEGQFPSEEESFS